MKKSKDTTFRNIVLVIYIIVAIGLIITSVATLLGYEKMRLWWAIFSIVNLLLLLISLNYASRDRKKRGEKDSENQDKTQ
jgi:membrane protein implicated in regulation of membrane protease activity